MIMHRSYKTSQHLLNWLGTECSQSLPPALDHFNGSETYGVKDLLRCNQWLKYRSTTYLTLHASTDAG